MKADREKTEAQGYWDPKSYMRADGTEVLHGLDWKKRKQELWDRCGGQCEYVNPMGQRCREDCHDPAHNIPRHPKRIDNLYNLTGMCRRHHHLTDLAMKKRELQWTKRSTDAER